MICRFFTGKVAEPTMEENQNCGHPVWGGNCNDPTHPCTVHYEDDEEVSA